MEEHLFIGNYDKNGIFKNKNWEMFLEVIGKICNSVRIYTCVNDEQVQEKLSNFAKIAKEKISDPNFCKVYKAYYLKCKSIMLWDAIKMCNFNIDNGIQNIYFMNNEIYIAELDVDDDDNEIIVNLSKEEMNKLFDSKSI